MITITKGNLLTSGAEALVNTVNTVGVMGKGIALQFKKAFPENYAAYSKACTQGKVAPGKMLVTRGNLLSGKKIIINFPTKRHWKGKSRIEDIEAGLKDLIQVVRENNIQSIAIPPLGCGLGGLAWPTVRDMIESAFSTLPDVDVYLYAPNGSPASEDLLNRTKKPSMTPGRAAFLTLLTKYIQRSVGIGITLIEVQKLCYFLQEAGEPLRLTYQKWYYGPYAHNLQHVISALDGHYLRGWNDGKVRPLSQLTLLAQSQDIELPEETEKRVARVMELASGFEGPYDMELLATVHWIISRELGDEPVTIDAVKEHVRRWTDRKNKLFQEHHIAVAIDRLRECNFVH